MEASWQTFFSRNYTPPSPGKIFGSTLCPCTTGNPSCVILHSFYIYLVPTRTGAAVHLTYMILNSSVLHTSITYRGGCLHSVWDLSYPHVVTVVVLYPRAHPVRGAICQAVHRDHEGLVLNHQVVLGVCGVCVGVIHVRKVVHSTSVDFEGGLGEKKNLFTETKPKSKNSLEINNKIIKNQYTANTK